ncbi:Serine/threonine-protein kinase SKY1 [Babesia sp. Xinjiang]|uniref:Serine/threonine-protein kinase SKY1 n=1 Tax=Babesia sp. Xinjiang TaxID=462227 RepID=UPI000A231489|nr:Serine/threonine-protein kinase SKY1 [Babesia sp. Xinjiang]ORM39906.1 Serine/threonine-protein kinase SKY1 [Babesia sp. Xinjiang]
MGGNRPFIKDVIDNLEQLNLTHGKKGTTVDGIVDVKQLPESKMSNTLESGENDMKFDEPQEDFGNLYPAECAISDEFYGGDYEEIDDGNGDPFFGETEDYLEYESVTHTDESYSNSSVQNQAGRSGQSSSHSIHSHSDDDDYDGPGGSEEKDPPSDTVDCTLSDSEDPTAYKPGGYHPVKQGDIYDGRYRIDCKLGWGYFSTVWLATDLRANPNCFVAIKFQRSAKSHADAVRDEMSLLKRVRDQAIARAWLHTKQTYKNALGSLYNPTRGVVSFLNWFRVKGPNGTHVCVVLEPMGPNLLSLIKFYKFKGVPMHIIRKITAHVLLGLDYLHRVCGIIHTDLKPENILVSSKLQGCTPWPTERQRIEEKVQARKTIVPYVKNTIKPSMSDPTSLTSYDEAEALQDTLYRAPYHHIPYKIAQPLRDTKAKPANVDMYHPWVAKKVNQNSAIAALLKQHVFVKTQQGRIQIKPLDQATFDHPDAVFKICDLGNACWINQHFTDEIQTRQYRSPEAILKVGYDESTDLWSLACIIFELITGDYLFDPHGNTTQERDINHLQLIVELLGPIPLHIVHSSPRYGHLEREINNVTPWPLESVMVRKYKMDPVDAQELSKFLLCMLKIDPRERMTADMLIANRWLHGKR